MVLNLNEAGYSTIQSASGLKADYPKEYSGTFSHDGYLAFWHKDLNQKQMGDIIEAANVAGLAIEESAQIWQAPSVVVRTGLYRRLNKKTNEPQIGARVVSSKLLFRLAGDEAITKWAGKGDGTSKASMEIWDKINDAWHPGMSSRGELETTIEILAEIEGVTKNEMINMYAKERDIAYERIKAEDYVPISETEVAEKWAQFENYLLEDLPIIDKFMADIKITDVSNPNPEGVALRLPSHGIWHLNYKRLNTIVIESVSKNYDKNAKFSTNQKLSERPLHDEKGLAGGLTLQRAHEWKRDSKGNPKVVDSGDTFHTDDVSILSPYWNKRIGKRLYLKAIQTLLKKGDVSFLQSGGSVSAMASRTWESLMENTSPAELVRLGFPDLVGTFNISRPAYDEAALHERAGSYYTHDNVTKSVVENKYSSDQYYKEEYKVGKGKVKKIYY